MKPFGKLFPLALLVYVSALSGNYAYADGVQLTLSDVSAPAGQDVTVFGTITNPGTGLVYLNGESFTLGNANFINGDVTDFFNNAPLSLVGGANSGLIALFSFEIAPGTSAGVYTGNFLQILGGPGTSDSLVLANTEFSVDVASTAVPEPTSLAFVITAAAVFFLFCSAAGGIDRLLGKGRSTS